MAYPPGMTTINVVGHLDAPNGKPVSGYVWAEAERKFGYVGTSWMMIRTTPKLALKAGDFVLTLPHSNQAGLLGDAGAAVSNIGWKILLQPLRDTVIQTLSYVLLPTSLGATVNLSALADLGGWPNATILTPPPSGGTGTFTPATVLGHSGYWSPA
jgi:hypothetical protein